MIGCAGEVYRFVANNAIQYQNTFSSTDEVDSEDFIPAFFVSKYLGDEVDEPLITVIKLSG